MSDRIWHWIARHAPVRLRYWCVVVAGAEATTGQYSNTIVPEVSLVEVLQRIRA